MSDSIEDTSGLNGHALKSSWLRGGNQTRPTTKITERSASRVNFAGSNDLTYQLLYAADVNPLCQSGVRKLASRILSRKSRGEVTGGGG